MFVLFLPGHLDERLFGFPVFLLELVHHRRVLALDEAVQIVSGVSAAVTDVWWDKRFDNKSKQKSLQRLLIGAKLGVNKRMHLQISSLHFSQLPEEKTEQVRILTGDLVKVEGDLIWV